MKCHAVVVSLLATVLCGTTLAVEPNDEFSSATVLAAGVSSIVDQLTVDHIYPDTFLGIRSLGGEIVLSDDDDSALGNGFASGLRRLSIESTSIKFAVTGSEDTDFMGEHTEAGEYKVFVDVYGTTGEPIDSFSEVRTLGAGVVDEFSFTDGTWVGGSYDVNIENRSPANDIDFYTFTALAPGAEFTARTSLTSSATVDTMLGWFDDAGTLLDADDDSGGGTLSLLNGIVPANGMLTLAVTGFGDPEFGGLHSQSGDYALQVTQETNPNGGDYNGNGIVDAADYTVWRDSLGQSGQGLAADGNLNEMIDDGDFVFWKSRFGQTVGDASLTAASGASTVPEPSAALLVVVCSVVFWSRAR